MKEQKKSNSHCFTPYPKPFACPLGPHKSHPWSHIYTRIHSMNFFNSFFQKRERHLVSLWKFLFFKARPHNPLSLSLSLSLSHTHKRVGRYGKHFFSPTFRCILDMKSTHSPYSLTGLKCSLVNVKPLFLQVLLHS